MYSIVVDCPIKVYVSSHFAFLYLMSRFSFRLSARKYSTPAPTLKPYHYLVVIFAFQVFNTSGTNNGKTTKRIDIDLVCYVKYVVDIDICNKEEC